MSLATNLVNLATRISTEAKALRTLINGNAANLAGLNTTVKTNLVAAINEVKGIADAGANNLDELTDVTISAPATGHVLRHNGSGFVNVAGDTYWQPRDSDLDAIGALATTAYGRALLELANLGALQALVGFDTDVTLAANSDVKVATQKAIKTYVDGRVDAANAFQYKGTLDASTNPNYPAASAGWAYRVSAAGKLGGAAGVNVEVGDTAVCLVDGSAAGTHATVGANWMVLQTNIDGAVIGPAASASGNLATFSGATGKVIQDSGLSLDTDGAMAANSNTRIPSQAAVRAYVAATTYNKTEIGNPETDLVASFEAGLA